MGNTLTNVTETMVQDEVLPALKLGLTPINAFSIKLTDTPKAKDDVVRVPIVSSRSAATYSSTWETGDSTTATKSVTMEAPTFAAWHVDPNTEGIPTAERFLAQGRECAYAVAKQVVQDVLELFVASNINDVEDTDKRVVTAANYSVDDQVQLWGLLKGKGVTGPISAIHTVDYMTNLLTDNMIQDRSASGSNVMTTGEMPPILGARQFYTDAFPTAVTSENTGVIYTGKETAAVAMTVPAEVEAGLEQASGVRIMQITDPDTGLSMVWRTWVNSATGYYWGAVYVMKGQAFLQNAAVRAVSA
jgi:hypothetical protein